MDATTDIVYVSEGGNHRISCFNSQGNFMGCFGSKGDDDNQFDSPSGLAIDKSGLLYICDQHNHRIVLYGQL